MIKYYYIVLNFDLTFLKPLHRRLNSIYFVWITVLHELFTNHTHLLVELISEVPGLDFIIKDLASVLIVNPNNF